jgi:hypothetical protein
MSRQHTVCLTSAQRDDLERTLRRRTISSLTRTHCRILLLADTGRAGYLTDAQIGGRVGCSARSVARTRATFATAGLATAIERRPRADKDTPRRVLSPEAEARVIGLTLEPVPNGAARWTVRLLTREVIARGIVPTISRETVRGTLKKGGVRPG